MVLSDTEEYKLENVIESDSESNHSQLSLTNKSDE